MGKLRPIGLETTVGLVSFTRGTTSVNLDTVAYGEGDYQPTLQ